MSLGCCRPMEGLDPGSFITTTLNINLYNLTDMALFPIKIVFEVQL